jgi:hypothetical protein
VIALKRAFSFLFATLFLLSLSVSCHKKSTSPRHSELPDFPNTIGSRFVYLFYDSLSMSSDTVTVQIRDTVSSYPYGRATIWVYSWSSKVDTGFVFFVADTVKVGIDPMSCWRTSTYVFPLAVGKIWEGAFEGDTNVVLDRVPISISAGDFSDAFLIREAWVVMYEEGQVLTWFVPKVGIIKKHHKAMLSTFMTANETWELLDYEITSR